MRALLPLAAIVGLAFFVRRRLATAPAARPALAPPTRTAPLTRPLPRGAYLHLLTDEEFFQLRAAQVAGRLH